MTLCKESSNFQYVSGKWSALGAGELGQDICKGNHDSRQVDRSTCDIPLVTTGSGHLGGLYMKHKIPPTGRGTGQDSSFRVKSRVYLVS